MLWSIKINSKLHNCRLLCYKLVRVVWAAVNDNGSRFGHHCCRRMSLDMIKHRGRHKNINFCLNLQNQLNCFNGGHGTNMRKATRHLGGMGSLNPRRWKDKRLHHHGGGVCWLFVLLWIDS
jgi:hypothetical protein